MAVEETMAVRIEDDGEKETRAYFEAAAPVEPRGLPLATR